MLLRPQNSPKVFVRGLLAGGSASGAKPGHGLERRLLVGWVAGSVVVGLAALAGAFFPLYDLLLEQREAQLLEQCRATARGVQQFERRIEAIAAQVSSRTRARGALEALNTERSTLAEHEAIVRPILEDALRRSRGAIAWLVRHDADGRRVIAMGSEVSPIALVPDAPEILLRGVVENAGERYVVVESAILDPTGRRVGTDQVGFDLAALRALLDDATLLSSDGQIALGAPLSRAWRDWALAPTSEVVADDEVGERLLTRAAVDDTQWWVVRSTPYASSITGQPLRRLFWIMAVLILVVVLATALSPVLLAPVSRRLVADARRIEEESASRLEAEEALRKHLDNLEEVVAERTASLERSNADLEQYAYLVSHDLKGPIRTISAFAEVLEGNEAIAEDPEALHQVHFVRQAAKRSSDMVDALLEHARVSRVSLAPTTVSLDEVTQEICGDLGTRIQDTGANIEVGQLPTLETDPQLVRCILQNLIENALKYRRPSTPPHVWVRSTDVDGRIVVEVEDNGVGFDPKHAERVFMKFSRLHNDDAIEGVGIGLALVQRSAERLGARVSASSRPGVGSCFRVEFGVDLEEDLSPRTR